MYIPAWSVGIEMSAFMYSPFEIGEGEQLGVEPSRRIRTADQDGQG